MTAGWVAWFLIPSSCCFLRRSKSSALKAGRNSFSSRSARVLSKFFTKENTDTVISLPLAPKLMELPSLSNTLVISSALYFSVSSLSIEAVREATPALERLFAESWWPPLMRSNIVTVGISSFLAPITLMPLGISFSHTGGLFTTGFWPEPGRLLRSKLSLALLYLRPA